MKWELDDYEAKKFKEWNEKHLAEKHNGKEPYCGAIGGRITFSVTGTSLGEIVTVKCGLCPKDEEENLTNWDEFG